MFSVAFLAKYIVPLTRSVLGGFNEVNILDDSVLADWIDTSPSMVIDGNHTVQHPLKERGSFRIGRKVRRSPLQNSFSR